MFETEGDQSTENLEMSWDCLSCFCMLNMHMTKKKLPKFKGKNPPKVIKCKDFFFFYFFLSTLSRSSFKIISFHDLKYNLTFSVHDLG